LMAERLSVRTDSDGVVRVLVPSQFDLAVEEPFVALVAEQLAVPGRRVVVDLGGVDFIDSSGVRALMRVHIHADRVALAGVREPVLRVLRIAGLDNVLVDGHDG